MTPSAPPTGSFGPVPAALACARGRRPASAQPTAWLNCPQMASGCQSQRLAADQPRGAPGLRPAGREQPLEPSLVLGEEPGADPVLPIAADATGVQDRLGVLEARRDRRAAAPRRTDHETAQRPVVAHEAERGLGRREGGQQVRPVLAGRGGRELGHRGQVGRLVRPDPGVDRLVAEPGRLEDPIPGLDLEPDLLVQRPARVGGHQEECPAAGRLGRVDRRLRSAPSRRPAAATPARPRSCRSSRRCR